MSPSPSTFPSSASASNSPFPPLLHIRPSSLCLLTDGGTDSITPQTTLCMAIRELKKKKHLSQTDFCCLDLCRHFKICIFFLSSFFRLWPSVITADSSRDDGSPASRCRAESLSFSGFTGFDGVGVGVGLVRAPSLSLPLIHWQLGTVVS